MFLKNICLYSIIFIFVLYGSSGCGAKTKGTVKKDISVTKQIQKLEEAGGKYSGPEYTVGIITFKNKTPSKVLGIGEAATDILRTLIKSAGFEPIMLSEDEIKEQDRLIELQQTGAIKTGKKTASEGFESVDYRIVGSITAYSEVEESSDVLVAQSKTRVARVQVDYVLVDITTGKSLVSKSVAGEYKKKTGGIPGFDSGSSAGTGLRDGALRDALSKALDEMIAELNKKPFQGKILLVEGNTVTFRGGTKSKLAYGYKLAVYRVGQDLVDTETGKVIGKIEKQIGVIIVTGHQSDRISDATISSGIGFQEGDIVRTIK